MKKFKISFDFESEELNFLGDIKGVFKNLFPHWKNLEVEEIKTYIPTDEEIRYRVIKNTNKNLNSEYAIYRQANIKNGVNTSLNFLGWLRYIRFFNKEIKNARKELIKEEKGFLK